MVKVKYDSYCGTKKNHKIGLLPWPEKVVKMTQRVNFGLVFVV